MELGGYTYSIDGGGSFTQVNPRIVGRQFLATLDALSLVDPIYSNWLLTDVVREEQIPIADVPDLIALVESNVDREPDGQPDPDGGYLMAGYNRDAVGPRTVSITVTAAPGGDFFKLRVGDDHFGTDATLINFPLFKASLLAVIANWPCAWATAEGIRHTLRHVPLPRGAIRVETESFHRLTWLAYLARGRHEGLELPASVLTEPTPDGGLLMITTEQRPDPSNAEQMARADALTRFMAARKVPRE
jgi:hypothetical protein